MHGSLPAGRWHAHIRDRNLVGRCVVDLDLVVRVGRADLVVRNKEHVPEAVGVGGRVEHLAHGPDHGVGRDGGGRSSHPRPPACQEILKQFLLK